MTRAEVLSRLMLARDRALCLARLHDWRYFIDGTVCLGCNRCHAVQYDLPGAGS